MRVFWGRNKVHTGSGLGMVRGTNHLPLVMPMIRGYHNPHISLLYIQGVRVGNGSNRMDRLVFHTRILWDQFWMPS